MIMASNNALVSDAVRAQRVAEQALVVVLPQDQQERKRAQIAPDIAERHTRAAAAVGPQVGSARATTRGQRRFGDAELGVDFERARLHAERPGLDRRACMAIYDHAADAASRQLIGQHEAGRPGADNEDVDFVGDGHGSEAARFSRAT